MKVTIYDSITSGLCSSVPKESKLSFGKTDRRATYAPDVAYSRDHNHQLSGEFEPDGAEENHFDNC